MTLLAVATGLQAVLATSSVLSWHFRREKVRRRELEKDCAGVAVATQSCRSCLLHPTSPAYAQVIKRLPGSEEVRVDTVREFACRA